MKKFMLLLPALALLFLGSAQDAQAQIRLKESTLCKEATLRLDTVIAKTKNRSGMARLAYQDIAGRLKEKGSSFQSVNPTAYDILKNYYTTLASNYVTKVISDYDLYLADLQNAQVMAKNGDCGHSEGAFRQALIKAKADYLLLKSDFLSSRAYYQTTIKPYLISLRYPSDASPTPTPTPTASPADGGASSAPTPQGTSSPIPSPSLTTIPSSTPAAGSDGSIQSATESAQQSPAPTVKPAKNLKPILAGLGVFSLASLGLGFGVVKGFITLPYQSSLIKILNILKSKIPFLK